MGRREPDGAVGPPSQSPPKTQVLFPLLSGGGGGSYLSAGTIARVLHAQGWEVLLGILDGGPGNVRSARWEPKGIPTVLLKTPYGVLRPRTGKLIGLAYIAWARRELRRLEVGLVHTNDARMHSLWLPGARSLGIPSIMNLRSGWDPALWAAGLSASQLVVNSDFTRRDLPRTLRQKSIVIPPPVDVTALAEAAEHQGPRAGLRARLGVRDATLVVVMVANLLGWKRPYFFIRAAESVLRSRSGDIVFVLIGEDRDVSAVELRGTIPADLMHDFGDQRGIVIAGPSWPADEDIREADLLCATSEGESFGRTLVEAMAAGTPVVVTGGDGKSEVVGRSEAGIVAEAGDVNDFAQSVERVLADHGLRRRMAAAGPKRVAELDLVNKNQIGFDRLYTALLKERT